MIDKEKLLQAAKKRARCAEQLYLCLLEFDGDPSCCEEYADIADEADLNFYNLLNYDNSADVDTKKLVERGMEIVHSLLAEKQERQLNTILAALDGSPELIEILAAHAHKQWAGWAKWMAEHWYTTTTGKESFQQRWERQAKTDYADLSEQEKESDRVEARNWLLEIRKALQIGEWRG